MKESRVRRQGRFAKIFDDRSFATDPLAISALHIRKGPLILINISIAVLKSTVNPQSTRFISLTSSQQMQRQPRINQCFAVKCDLCVASIRGGLECITGQAFASKRLTHRNKE